jgi:hypothetical protein
VIGVAEPVTTHHPFIRTEDTTTMAVKKTATKSSGAKAAPKKAAPKKAATPKAATKTTPKKSSPKAPKKAAPKKAAPVKLTDKQKDILKKVGESKTDGYLAPKVEARILESLQTKKLIKRGAKDKVSGNYRYLVTKTGQKHIDTPAPSPSA